MTDKYCPLRFREYDSNPHDQRCIGEYCAWYGKCSQSHGEPIYGSVCDATNGIDCETNGIRAGAPLVDEPPESDAIAHARWRWQYRPEDGDEVVMNEYNCNLLMSDLDAIADMVERDYVSRQDFDAQHRTLCGVREQRDHESEANRSYARVIAKLESERDEWRAKAESILNTESYKFASEPDAEIYTDCGKVEDDSREKLESDIADSLCLFAHYAHDHYEHETVMQMVADRKSEFAAFLDRQATITRFQETSNQPDSGFVAQKQAETAENDTAKSEIRDFDDTREKLEADAHMLVDAFTDTYSADSELFGNIIELLDRQAAITERHWMEIVGASANANVELKRQIDELQAKVDELESLDDGLLDKYLKRGEKIARLQAKVYELTAELERETLSACNSCAERIDLQAKVDEMEKRLAGNARHPFAETILASLDSRENELKLQEQVDELTKERDYWKQEVQYCMDAAYPKSHSPERRYDPNVMAYPDRKGCTTPSTLVCDIIDGLRDEKGEMYMGLVKELTDIKDENAKLSSDELHWHSEADFWKRKYELICKALIDLNRNYVHVEDEGLA